MATVKVTLLAEDQASGEVQKLSATFGNLGKEATGAAKQVEDLSRDLNGVKANAKSIQAEIKSLEAELIKNKQAFGANSDEVKKTSEALGQARASFKQAQSSIAGVEGDLLKAKQAAKDAASSMAGLGNEASKAGKGIADAEKPTKGLGDELGKIKGKAGEASGGLGGMVGKLGELAKGGAAAALGVVSVGEALKKSIEIASEFQSGQSKMQAQLGLTGEEAKKLAGISENVFKTGFGENITEVNAELTGLKQSFKNLSDTDLQNLTRQGLILKQTFGVESAEQVKVLSSVTKNFGLDGSTALDLITASFQKGGNQADDLLDTLNEYSPQFARAGFTAQEFAGILVTGLNNGAFNADKVADSIKEFTIRIQDGSTTTAAGLQAIGLNQADLAAKIGNGSLTIAQAQALVNEKLRGVKDTVQQNIAGVALYGTQWEDVGSKVILSLDQGKNALGEFKGSTDAAGKALSESFDFQLKKLGNNVQVLAKDIGGAFLPAFTKITEALIPVVQGFSEKLAPVIEKITPLIEKVGQAFVDYLGPFASGALQGLQNALDQIMPAIDQLGKAFSDAGITADGLGQVMGGVVGTTFTIVGAAAGTLINSVTAVIEVFNAIKQAVEDALGPLKGVGDALGSIGSIFGGTKPQLDSAKTSMDAVGASAAQTGQSLNQAATGTSDWGVATTAAATQFTAAKPAIDTHTAAAQANATAAKDAAVGTSDWGAATTNASTAVAASAPAIGSVVAPMNQLTGATNATKQALGTMPAAATAASTGVASAVTTGMGQATTAATTGGQAIASGVKTGLEGATKEAKKNVDDLVKVTEDGFKNLGESMKALNEKLLTGLSDAISKSTDQIKESLKGVESAVSNSSDKIVGELGKMRSEAEANAKAIGDASAKGFEGVGDIFKEIKDLLKEFVDSLKGTGLQIGQNLADGINAGKAQVVAAAQGVASAASSAMAGGDFLGAITGGGRGVTPPAAPSTPGTGSPPPKGNTPAAPGRDSGLSGIGRPASAASNGLGGGRVDTGVGAGIGGRQNNSFAGIGTQEQIDFQQNRRNNRQSAGGGYADGLENAPNDMLALIHKGELVAPAGISANLRRNLSNVGNNNGGGNNQQPVYITVPVYLDTQEIGRIMMNQSGQQLREKSGVGLAI